MVSNIICFGNVTSNYIMILYNYLLKGNLSYPRPVGVSDCSKLFMETLKPTDSIFDTHYYKIYWESMLRSY